MKRLATPLVSPVFFLAWESRSAPLSTLARAWVLAGGGHLRSDYQISHHFMAAERHSVDHYSLCVWINPVLRPKFVAICCITCCPADLRNLRTRKIVA
jgi:hypothetical protein